MASITVDVSQAIRKIDPKGVDQAIKKALGPAASLLMAEAKRYPPPPPTSSYVRTGKLHGSWQKKVESRRATVGSYGVKYAPYVQGAVEQAWMHKGRWKTTAHIVQEQARTVERMIRQELARWAR